MNFACLILAVLAAFAFVKGVLPKKNGERRNIVFLILSGTLAVGLGAAAAYFFII
jgi:uncharacterized membrane protein